MLNDPALASEEPTEADVEREQQRLGDFAPDWLRRYREPIDCDGLQLAASVTLAEGLRLENAARLLYRKYAALLSKQARERRALLRQKLRGSRVSFRELSRRERRAAREKGAPRLATAARVFQQEILEYERHTAALRSRLRQYAEGTQSAARLPMTREEDYALARAAYLVSEWIRARHRNVRGEADHRVRWLDVGRCLEWYGHDLSHIATDKANALRKLAQRWARRWLPRPERVARRSSR